MDTQFTDNSENSKIPTWILDLEWRAFVTCFSDMPIPIHVYIPTKEMQNLRKKLKAKAKITIKL